MSDIVVTIENYQTLASRTANNDLEFRDEFANYALGVAGESGEVADLLSRDIVSPEYLKKELGDVTWYISQLCRLLKMEFSYVALKYNGYLQQMDPRVVALLLSKEAGEIADYVKKVVYHGHALENLLLQEKMVKVLNIVEYFCQRYSFTLQEVLQANIEKLRKRYPAGFDKEKSRNREV